MGNTSFSSGFATGYGITSAWKQKQENKKMIQAQEEQAKAFAMDLGARFDRDRKSGTGISQEEYENGLGFYMGASTEQMTAYKNLYKESMNMTAEEIKSNLEELKAMQDMYADVDLSDINGMEQIINSWKSPKAKQLGQAQLEKWKKQAEKNATKVETETFTSLAEAERAYPDKTIKYSPSSNVYYPEGEKTQTDKPAEFQKKIDVIEERVASGSMTRKQGDEAINGILGLKAETPDKPLEYKQKMADIDKGEADGTYTPEEAKAMRQRLLGGSAPIGEKTISYPMVKQVRDDMYKADTWGEAVKILEDVEGADYSTEQIKIEEEKFNAYKIKENTAKVDIVIKRINELLGEKGSLRGGDKIKIGSREQTKLEWYKEFYAGYQKYLDKLSKFTSIEGYRKLTPPEELKKTGIGLDTITSGGKLQAGDFENIWQ